MSTPRRPDTPTFFTDRDLGRLAFPDGLCCDSKHRKRRRPAERAALLDSGVREFVLNGNVPAAENVARVLQNLPAIVAACRRPGPFVFRVHPSRIERLGLGRSIVLHSPIEDFS